MQRQHRHRRIFDHALRDARLDHSHDADMGRQATHVELVDTGADGKQYLQCGQCGDQFD